MQGAPPRPIITNWKDAATYSHPPIIGGFFMSLKHELQNLTTETIKEISDALTARLDSVSEADLEAEALAAVLNYPALNDLTHLVLAQGLVDGLDIEGATQRATGASQALLVLTTIADIQELPKL